MDAWETLLDTSTLIPPGFDAWEHLNAQEGGSGDCIDAIGPSTADVDYQELSADIGTLLSVSVEEDQLEADLQETLSTSTDDENLTAEVCP